jgi:hypothetical protein
MITQTRFFGMPLITQAQRRRIVVGYYLMLGLATLPPLILNKPVRVFLAIQALTIGGLLGGIQPGGPVRSYQGVSNAVPSGIQTLNLSGFKPWNFFAPLDERETTERDAAHYQAFVILRGLLLIAVCMYFLLLGIIPRWLALNSPTLFWLLTVIIISLPQSVILWTEASTCEETDLTRIR